MIEPTVIKRLQTLASSHNLTVIEIDNERPWGGEFIFDNAQVKEFLAAFFPEIDPKNYLEKLAMPKFLIVAPHQRFSWQYHHRRGELWQVIEGPIGMMSNITDEQSDVELIVLRVGDSIISPALHRHRLVGLDGWGVVAELWIHSDIKDPSTEDDIVRVQDDYGRPSQA